MAMSVDVVRSADIVYGRVLVAMSVDIVRSADIVYGRVLVALSVDFVRSRCLLPLTFDAVC